MKGEKIGEDTSKVNVLVSALNQAKIEETGLNVLDAIKEYTEAKVNQQPIWVGKWDLHVMLGSFSRQ